MPDDTSEINPFPSGNKGADIGAITDDNHRCGSIMMKGALMIRKTAPTVIALRIAGRIPVVLHIRMM